MFVTELFLLPFCQIIETMTDKYYSSKLLLLGEHIVLKGAHALAMPLPLYGGRFRLAKSGEKIAYPLTGFLEYLQELKQSKALLAAIDLKALADTIKQGLYFQSNIPIGYGLGSSGAFVAAVYDQFCEKNKKAADFHILKIELAQLESYFHGSSSGTDPLICYLNQVVLISSDTGIKTVIPPIPNNKSGYTIFLIDTKIPRKTGPYVETFLTNCEEQNYLERCQSELIPLSNDAIAAFLQSRWVIFFQLIHEISFFQFKYFSAMIPNEFREIWLDGLGGNDYKLKLCGAGGGGFILGITKNFSDLQTRYPLYHLQAIFTY